MFGRKWIFAASLVTCAVGQMGLIYAQTLNSAIGFMLVVGLSFPGKNIVGLNYVLEFLQESSHTFYVSSFMLMDCLSLLGLSYGYQRVSRGWLWVQQIGVGLTLAGLAVCIVLMPESPKYFYLNRKYEEARRSLKRVARIN